MTTRNREYFYWDSNVFLAYLNPDPRRAKIVQRLWEDIEEDPHKTIVTSTISVTEVAYLKNEKGRLRPENYEAIRRMWLDPTIQLLARLTF